ncbi:hypothetical protein MCAG_05256 [Micromonospora sp. ATCC 39149]|nr:hypothetical protein MCAG_05256 [Micromonospora sp. ATCC 39149]
MLPAQPVRGGRWRDYRQVINGICWGDVGRLEAHVPNDQIANRNLSPCGQRHYGRILVTEWPIPLHIDLFKNLC